MSGVLQRIRGTALAIGALMVILVACMPVTGVYSPDGRIEVRIGVDPAGEPGYEVRVDGKPVTGWSRLGLVLADNEAAPGRYRLAESRREARDETWEQPWGERRLVRDHHNELVGTFRSNSGSDFRLRVRVFDDGVGFRYEVDGEGDIAIADELTEINLVGPGTAWWQPADGKVRYEHLYRGTPLAELEAAHTPVTVVMDNGLHLAVHEAALVDYAEFGPFVVKEFAKRWILDAVQVDTV